MVAARETRALSEIDFVSFPKFHFLFLVNFFFLILRFKRRPETFYKKQKDACAKRLNFVETPSPTKPSRRCTTNVGDGYVRLGYLS